MAFYNRPLHEEAMTDINPYVCKISNATFTKRCTVKECFANVDNLNKAGVDVEAVSGCAYVDFHLAGFAEELDYAVEEQGFVGYRDLQYLSPFFRTHSIKLRDVYTNNVELFRRSVAILWAVKNNNNLSSYCENCGHPLEQGSIRCRSTTMCEERREAAYEIIKPFMHILEGENIVKAYNAIWQSLNEKYTPRITFTEDEVATLHDLRIGQ